MDREAEGEADKQNGYTERIDRRNKAASTGVLIPVQRERTLPQVKELAASCRVFERERKEEENEEEDQERVIRNSLSLKKF